MVSNTKESRNRDLKEKKFGLMAKEYVKSHMPLGSTQTLITCKDGKGKYGRILGKFKMKDGSILNENMIDEHHAVAYYGQSKESIEEEHIKNRSFFVE